MTQQFKDLIGIQTKHSFFSINIILNKKKYGKIKYNFVKNEKTVNFIDFREIVGGKEE